MVDASSCSARFLLVLWLISLAALATLYSGSFQNKPAGDDFAAPLTEIARGTAEGPLAFFRMSAQPHNYRPIQSWLMWRFGSITDVKERQLAWIRVLHLGCMAAYLGAAVMFVSRLPIGRLGAIAAMGMMVAHPVLPGAVGGVDGFAGPLASAIMWLGALAVTVWIDRLAILLPVIVLCFLIGGITKEYSFGLGPLAVWGALVFSQKNRWRNAVIVGFTLVATLAALMYLRSFTIPPGLDAGLSYVTLSPANWIKNIGLLIVALLFMGNTTWVMVSSNVTAYAVVAASIMALFILIGLGLLWRWSPAVPHADDSTPQSRTNHSPSAARWIVYLLGSMPLAAAAPILTERVSEMYSIGLILPLSLLLGLAIDGWLRQGAAVRWIGSTCAAAVIACAAVSSHAKIALLRDVGDQANNKLHAMLAALPADVHDETIAVVYRYSDVVYQPRYSVFMMNDFIQISQPAALQWIAPERGITLEPTVVDDWVTVTNPKFKHTLLWRPETHTFELQK